VTALLNDSTWFGSADAGKVLQDQSTCTSNRFDISSSTDLPYDNKQPKRPVTGCLGDCIPSQFLFFQNIPLAVGKYEIVTLNSCGGRNVAVTYNQVVGGDMVINSYSSQNSKIGWIQVTGYNADQNAVEGAFEVELFDRTSKSARFRKGAFKALIK
jgi:hypothetical protein